METQDIAAPGTRSCPECGAVVPVHAAYVDWCDGCGWNVDPGEPQPAPGRLEALRRELARRHGEQLFEEPSGAARPGLDASTAVALLIALVVHAVTLTLAVGGLLLVVLGWSTVVQPLIGAGCLMVAVVLRPRLGSLPKDVPVLHRADAPRLFALVDEVASVVGTRGVDAVVVEPCFNASVTAYGIRQRRVLTLGIALWESATPRQRVALLGHELGHYAGGDVRAGLITGTALRTLANWLYFLEPVANPRDMGERLVNVAYFLPRHAAFGLIVVLDQLTLRGSQRAEYRADELAARAGSSEAAVAVMDLLLVGDSAHTALETAVTRAHMSKMTSRRDRATAPQPSGQDLWDRVTARTTRVPERERARLLRIAELRGHSADATHPPTHLRRLRLERAEPEAGEVVLDAAGTEALGAELASAKDEVARRVLNGG
ncbi:M48 family metallopeptidase [Streptomyces sp. NBC_00237]|uniref:M48 family metallopeptidase n=1 Tax=Streptomyces sp. NBC_00237 TaxID=2975687 RepID=UPI002250C2CC|nr:M48 family metallopeptidase [Streptomyces sp. NBC_00237]MCX5203070.1 M48 family metallopeptidase [Streptomyces sp. NBC_00237]